MGSADRSPRRPTSDESRLAGIAPTLRADRPLAAPLRPLPTLAPTCVAGLTTWGVMVPVALAYATLAGLPPEYGLITAFAALAAYAVFGTSRHLRVTTSSTMAIMSFVAGDAPRRRRCGRASSPSPRRWLSSWVRSSSSPASRAWASSPSSWPSRW